MRVCGHCPHFSLSYLTVLWGSIETSSLSLPKCKDLSHACMEDSCIKQEKLAVGGNPHDQMMQQVQ